MIACLTERRSTPDDAMINRLARLATRQREIADELETAWELSGRPRRMMFGVADSDRDAQSIGWPSRASQLVIAELVMERRPELTLIPSKSRENG